MARLRAEAAQPVRRAPRRAEHRAHVVRVGHVGLLGGGAAHELPLLTRAPVPPPLDTAHERGERARKAVARDEAIPG